VRRVLEWSIEVGLVRVLEVFDRVHRRCGRGADTEGQA
jgi:hypothetical protein